METPTLTPIGFTRRFRPRVLSGIRRRGAQLRATFFSIRWLDLMYCFPPDSSCGCPQMLCIPFLSLTLNATIERMLFQPVLRRFKCLNWVCFSWSLCAREASKSCAYTFKKEGSAVHSHHISTVCNPPHLITHMFRARTLPAIDNNRRYLGSVNSYRYNSRRARPLRPQQDMKPPALTSSYSQLCPVSQHWVRSCTPATPYSDTRAIPL